ADRLSGRRISHFLQEVEVTEGVAGLGVGGVLEESRDVREPLDVGDPREVQVPAIGLRPARERLLEILNALAALQRLARHDDVLSWWMVTAPRRRRPPSWRGGRRWGAVPAARCWHPGHRP